MNCNTAKVYVLELEGGNYYIGRTNECEERLRRHFKGTGARWARKHKPLKVVEVVIGGKAVEKSKTLEYMRRYGWEKVRGYAWTACDLIMPPICL